MNWQPVCRWGVLCIDIWHDNGKHNDFYRCAMEHLQDYNIKLVVNCSTDIEISYQDRSVYNTLQRYLWTATHDNAQINDKILSDMIKNAGKNQTSKILNDSLFSDSTVHVTDKDTFIHNATFTDNNISDWIILGAAWKICVHHGPLGINTLVDMYSHKFHFFPKWSIQTENQTVPSDQSINEDWVVWAPIPGDGYRLITRANTTHG